MGALRKTRRSNKVGGGEFMRILGEAEIKELGYLECFGQCLGGTACWDSCGDHEDTTYVKCLLQAKALIDEALEAELLGDESEV